MLKIKCITLVIFSLFFLAAVQAKTVSVVDYGAIVNDGIDDSKAVQAAFLDLIGSEGGTVVFPAGTIDLSSGVDIHPRAFYLSYYIKGDRGSVVRLSGKPDIEYFSFIKANQVEFEGLMFLGEDEKYNATSVIVADDVAQTKISNCAFFNVGASVAVIDAKDTDLTVEKTMFEGSAAEDAIIRAVDSRGVTVASSTFMNVGRFLNATYQRAVTNRIGAWIRIANYASNMSVNGQRISRIVDSRFDDAAKNGIFIENQKSVEISGIVLNIQDGDGFNGLNFTNVEYADVKNSKFLSRAGEKAAMDLKVNTFVEVNSLTFSEGLTTAVMDDTSRYQIGYCPSCTVPLAPKTQFKLLSPVRSR